MEKPPLPPRGSARGLPSPNGGPAATEGRASRSERPEGRGEGRTPAETIDFLLAAQRSLRSRWDDFRQAFERRDGAAYRFALMDFLENLRRWTVAEEKALLPALARTSIAGRDSQRELKLEYVQIRELTRYLQSQIAENAQLGDTLGIIENLERRLRAHESEMEGVYYPAVTMVLTREEIQLLANAAPTS